MEYHSFKPGQPMLDTNGKRIQAHGGGLLYEDGIYYWYGENKEFSIGTKRVWTWGIRCYSSKDLYNWKDEGLMIPPDTENKGSSLHPSRPVDRPHILKNRETGKYVCWLKLSGRNAYFTVLTADTLMGPYTIVRDRVRPFGKKAGDFDLWQDDRGIGYICFEHDHNGVISAPLSPDFLDAVEPFRDMFVGLKPPFTREGITHFTHEGRHYLLTSGMTGYVPNPSEVAVSDDPLGPYVPIGNPHRNDESGVSFHSQVSAILPHPEIPGLYLTLADRWIPKLRLTGAQSERMLRALASCMDRRYHSTLLEKAYLGTFPWNCARVNTSLAEYVWLPMAFEDGMPVIDWHEEWTIEEQAKRGS